MWFKQTVTWAAKSGVSGSGDPTFSAQVALPARVKLEPMMKRHGADGSELVSGTLVDLLQQVGVEDRFWLPGTDTSKVDQSRTPMDVVAIVDELGATLYWHAVF